MDATKTLEDSPMNRIPRRTLLVSAALSPALARPALAQARWPNRPVQMICPWAAGGGTDAVVRIVAQLLERELGQPFNVVNRTGGSGAAGSGTAGAGDGPRASGPTRGSAR